MMNDIFELLHDIAKETDITIRLNKRTNDLEFIYKTDEELKQKVQQSDIEEYKNNQAQLLEYVLKEINSTILGSKE